MSDLDSLARISVSSYPQCLHYKCKIRNQSLACEEFFFILDPGRRCLIKMISAQHSSNNGKNWQKLSYQKILLAW